jgi:hypothetical protein
VSGVSIQSSVCRVNSAPLQELDGGNFERVALYFACDVDSQVIFLPDILSASAILPLPAASNLMNFLSLP